MGFGEWFTLACIALGVWAWVAKPSPRRRRVQGGIVARPLTTYQHQPRRKAQQPVLPLLAKLLAKTAADIKQLWHETRSAAVEGWQSGGQRRAHMSTIRIADPALLSREAPATPGTDTGSIDNAAITAPDIGDIADIPEARARAIRKWKAGEKLSQNDVLAMLAGNRNAMLALIRSVEAGEG